MTNFRGLRARILLLLLVIVLPVFALSALWSIERDAEFRRFEVQAVAASVASVDERLTRLADRAHALRALLPQDTPCTILQQDLVLTGFDLGQVVGIDGPSCTAGAAPLGAATLDALRTGLAAGDDPAWAEEGNALVLGIHFGDRDELVALRLTAEATNRLLDPKLTPFLGGVALAVAGHVIAERHLPAEAAAWWPSEDLPASSGLVGLQQADGGSAGFFIESAAANGRQLVVGLKAQPLLGTGRWQLWSNLAQLAAAMLATVAGAVWAIDRSVLRWIGYLRRIAVAHARGHYAVRAQSLASAPLEIAELGDSLNLMASDAGRRVAELRETAADKSALLLELHHRVKNNFQVITSLLSLHRHDLPQPRREDIRFVEDFVRAMAVAYRVAYDAGDVTGVVLQDLLSSVVEGLRDLAGTPPGRIVLRCDEEPIWISLDKAISLGLYLSVVLPPYLDAGAVDPTVARIEVSILREGAYLRVAVGGAAPLRADRPPMRHRLRAAYVRQLKASPDAAVPADETVIHVPLDDARDPTRLAAVSLTPPPRKEPVDPIAIAEGWDRVAVGAGLMLSAQGADLRYRWAFGAPLFGTAVDAMAGRTDSELLPPEAAAALTRAKLQVLADGAPVPTVLHVVEPAPERWFAVHIQPMTDDSGRVAGVLAASRDVTTYKGAEKRMTLLMREMAHRSKNILAVTEAMARQSLHSAVSLEDFGARFSARLHALAASHDLLTRRDWEGAGLRDLVRSQLGHYLHSDPPQIAIDGPELFLTATAIPYLGLALHELSTNAAKHGALSVAQGRVAVAWTVAPDADGKTHLTLTWTETGGPPVVRPTRRGFGTDVTKRIVSRALRGDVTLDFAAEGVVWQLTAPVANLASKEGARGVN